MRKYLIVVFCFSVGTFIYGQNIASKVNTKYLRPSLTSLFFQPKTSQDRVVIAKMNELPVMNKFDDNRIDFPYLNYSGVSEADKNTEIQKYVQKASRIILEKWWNRDANGDFNTEFVGKRGGYSAIDADVIQNKASNTNRIEMIGADLIEKSYVFLYEITDVLTMEQIYDKTDAANRNYSNYKPVKRDNEGYEISYKVYAYKLNFNDSVSSVFYNNYWSDAKNHNSQKVANWNTATFPMIFKTSLNGKVRSTQPKDPSSSVYQYKKKKNMNELLEDAAIMIQTNSTDELGIRVEDFKPLVSVYKTKPLSAKLGIKESLYLDQRFFVYEIEVDDNGNQNKIRKGVARVKQISDNNSIATGESKPSTFQQQGGKKLFEGMLMESKEDRGIMISGGYSSVKTDYSLGGINLALDYRISRIAKVTGLNVGIDFSINPMTDVKPGNTGITNVSDNYSGYTYAFAANVSKEMYFTRKGNFFIKPAFGIGLAKYYFTSSDNSSISFDIPDPNDATKTIHNKDYEWSSIYVPMSLALSINISPDLVLQVKPGFMIKFASTTGNSVSLYSTGSNTPNWGFDTLDVLSARSSLVFNVSYRF